MNNGFELTTVINSERKKICTMRRELKGLELKCCVDFRKSHISEANMGGKGFSLTGSIKIGENGHVAFRYRYTDQA